MSRIARAGLPLALVAALVPTGPVGATGGPDTTREGATTVKLLPRAWAARHHVKRAKGDPDRDGLTNWGEHRSRTNPRRADSDRDGTRDGAEDSDRDGTPNAVEERTGRDPRDPGDADQLIARIAEQGDENDPYDEQWDEDPLVDLAP